MIVCLAVVCIISFFENRRLSVTEYQIKDPLIPHDFHGYHIVQLSDLHNASFGKNNEKLIQKVTELEPHLILITGDMIIGKPGKDVTFAADTMNALARIAPVCFSMGNHELRASIYTDKYQDMWEQFKSRLSPDIRLLLDEKMKLVKGDSHICLYGLNLTPKLYRRMVRTPMPEEYLTSLFGSCNPKEYHIFMAHNPDYFKEYAGWGANLTFSGHVHGGMIRIPILGGMLSPMIHFFPPYDKGLFVYSNKYMILSGGLGNHTFKFRVNNLPEIVSVILNEETV
ncbi:MAG: metallophosphoesterase [Bacteroidales bacterium]|nr:metallophosphoesterase [Clostridium sp.]MCM1203025.1 metallophosphoesterase [Bacteroidales bacterium]